MNAATSIGQLKGSLEHQNTPASADLPHWLSAQRRGAVEAFAKREFPQRREEEWRYTPVDTLLSQPFTADTDAQAPRAELLEPYRLTDTPACRLVFVNGRFAPAASTPGKLPDGVTVTGLGSAIGDMPDLVSAWLGRVAVDGLHSFSALNGAQLQDGLFVHITAGCRLDQPIEVLHLGRSRDDAIIAYPRSLVVLEQGAEATLVERFVGLDDDAVYFHNGVSEIQLEPGAQLTHHRLQQESPAAWHLQALFVNQQRDSRYRGSLYALGGRWSRSEVNIAFLGEGAECELSGAYTVADQQLTDVHINVQHRVSHCHSEVDFKGILQGKGRGVFDGSILVAADAQHSEAHLNNANLVLERSAEIDTKPQLEIHADNVRCSHGTTVGQLDPNQVFYLRSRGIDETRARRMLALGFAAETLQRCGIHALRTAVESDIAERIGSAATDKGD